MKRFLLFFILLVFALTPVTDAALGSKGLIINNGASAITIQKGERKTLWVRDGLTGVPLLKGVTFYSDNRLVATVDKHSGILRGNSAGTAHITAMSSSGRSGYLTVTVTAVKKKPFWGGLLMLILLLIVGIWIFKQK